MGNMLSHERTNAFNMSVFLKILIIFVLNLLNFAHSIMNNIHVKHKYII